MKGLPGITSSPFSFSFESRPFHQKFLRQNSEALATFLNNANNGPGVTPKKRGFLWYFFAQAHTQKMPLAVKTNDNPSF
jgi:hypothetical protein